MSINELGKQLYEMYSSAPHGEQVAHIHLFGIKYANEILRNNYTIKEIIRISGLKESYSTELSKGIKLSKYVLPKS